MDFKDLDTSLTFSLQNVNLYANWLYNNRSKLISLKESERSSYIKSNIGPSSGNPGAVVSYIKKTGLANGDLLLSEMAELFASGFISFPEYCFIHLSKESLFLGDVPKANLLVVIAKYVTSNNLTKFFIKDIRPLDESLTPVTGDTTSNDRNDLLISVLDGTGLFKHVGNMTNGEIEVLADTIPILSYIANSTLTNCDLQLNSKKRFNFFADASGGVFDILSPSLPVEWVSNFPHLTSMGLPCPGCSGNEELQQIFYGAPGTGKSYKINQITENESVIRTTFHPDSDYSTFVGAYKPTTKQIALRDANGAVVTENGATVMENRIVYEYVEQAFLQSYIKAWQQFIDGSNKGCIAKHYLVIEEINRGNCAQVFGDVFQLLDRNKDGFSTYPVTADHDIQNHLSQAFAGVSIPCAPYINSMYGGKDIASKIVSGELLVLPSNLYIWATMNTSDQSLFPIDSAFKRRWEWQYIPIRKGRDDTGQELEWFVEVKDRVFDWWSFLEKINKEIGDTTSSEDKKLGFFFCKAENDAISSRKFVGKVIFYLWNDVYKDFGFDNSIFKDKDGTQLSFDKFYTEDISGKTVVSEDVLMTFMNNLGVDDFIIENDTPSRFNYKFDGSGPLSLRDIAKKVVEKYVATNTGKTAQEVRDTFVNACTGIGIAHVVETEAEYSARKGQKSAERTVSEITLPNGEHIYVSTQWRANDENSNFSKFIEVVKNNGWGVISK